MAKKADRNEKGQFIIGNPGREKIYTDPKELQKAVDSYFEHQDKNPLFKTEFHGKDAIQCFVPVQRPYTFEGLAEVLGFSRFSLLNYEKKEGYEPFFNIISRAKEKIRTQWIELGIAGLGNPGFTKFILVNNARYQDKSEVDHTTGGKSMNTIEVTVQDLRTKEKIKKL